MTHLLNGNDMGKHVLLFLFILQFPIYSSSVGTNFLLLKYYVAFFHLFVLLFTTLTPFGSWVQRLFGLEERNRKIEKNA